MPTSRTLPDFVRDWHESTQSERQGAQSHFNQLCEILGVDNPAADTRDSSYAFEAATTRAAGGSGRADVWKRGYFAWEYKSKGEDLRAAYTQLLGYHDALDNPPLLVTCDFERFEVHTNFTNTTTRVYSFTLADFLQTDPLPGSRLSALDVLRAVFTDPERLRPNRTPAQVTEEAAKQFAKLASSLRARDVNPQAAARFLIRLLFCLYAEDAGLLPERLLSRLVDGTRKRSWDFAPQVGRLFQQMASGGYFGVDRIQHFNGGLFTDAEALTLTADDLDVLAWACALEWDRIEPSIFGTLFERSLDPASRAPLGAHYTSRADIDTVVEPVLMAPLRREWSARRDEAEALAAMVAAARGKARERHQQALQQIVDAMIGRIAGVQVLDPACGSGNFLYVALRHLLDLEHEVNRWAFEHGCKQAFPRVDPAQLHGIEINEYAHELAQVVVWIGYIQWLKEHGWEEPREPILRPLDSIRLMDAILARDGAGALVEPEWPEADVIIGNPPFLGDKKMRSELGDTYVEALRRLYAGRVPGGADLVCYWFERARALIAAGTAKRAGLLATQGIRGGANRKVLARIKEGGDIFWAWADRDWVLDGATVHVSMVGFDAGSEVDRTLDGKPVPAINSDLTGAADVASAVVLAENLGIAFVGDQKGGDFDILPEVAQSMLAAPLNPNGRPNSDVVRPWVNGRDITDRPRGMYIVDFLPGMSFEAAALYEMPFRHAEQYVFPTRVVMKGRDWSADYWWHHQRARPEFRGTVAPLHRYIGTPRVAKHRLFVWLDTSVLPDCQLIVFAREDDWFLGVLQARPHELWSRRQGTQLREATSGCRYTPTTCFETYPMPTSPPGLRPSPSPRSGEGEGRRPGGEVVPGGEVAQAARELARLRDAWLNPPDASEEVLKQRTLTKLYNARPTWLAQAHERLDRAVFAAYGWPWPLTDEEILERLLALNRERAGA